MPVYSVDTEEEAEELLAEACPMSVNGEYVATELAEGQTLDNLSKFSDRLAKVHSEMTGEPLR